MIPIYGGDVLKRSRQREAILTFLKGRTDHPTADVIYQHLKEEIPGLSPGTVYRNLALLSAAGEIARVSVGDTAEHYDGNPAPHYHFFCSSCGALEDVHMPVLADLNILAGQFFPGNIAGHSVYFHGTCQHCKEVTENNLQKVQISS